MLQHREPAQALGSDHGTGGDQYAELQLSKRDTFCCSSHNPTDSMSHLIAGVQHAPRYAGEMGLTQVSSVNRAKSVSAE